MCLNENSKSEYRNPKQYQCSNSWNSKHLKLVPFVLVINISVIWICFEFRISCFEFVILFMLCVLCGSPRGIPDRPRLSCSPEALFHGASHRISGSLHPNSFAIPKGMCPRSSGPAPRSPDETLQMNSLVTLALEPSKNKRGVIVGGRPHMIRGVGSS